MSQALTVVGERAVERFDFTDTQKAMIYDTYANGASADEFAVLLEIAKTRRLNPMLKQIHFVKRYNGQLKREVWACQASIDGLRAIAQRTGFYAGSDEPEFTYDDGKLIAAKVKIYRKDWARPAVGVAHWSEYVQTTREGAPTKFWKDMPHVMLAKVAEAQGLRKAFPEDMSGLYSDDEMMQADKPKAIEHDADTGEVTPLETQLEQSLADVQQPEMREPGADEELDPIDEAPLFRDHITRILDARTPVALTQALARVAHDKGKLSQDQLAQLRDLAAKQKAAVGK